MGGKDVICMIFLLLAHPHLYCLIHLFAFLELRLDVQIHFSVFPPHINLSLRAEFASWFFFFSKEVPRSLKRKKGKNKLKDLASGVF